MIDEFGDRIKGFEAASDIKLAEGVPVIMRLDGNSFSKFTKQMGFKKPFDDKFFKAMCSATEAVLRYCGGSQIGYTQSDEITILLRNDMNEETQPFLANRLTKLASLCAATASVAFNKALLYETWDIYDNTTYYDPEDVYNDLQTAVFDCRVFLVPENEVNNTFLWRQQDAFKNCHSTVAYYGLSDKYGKKTAQKMLHGKSITDREEIILQELDIDMNDYPLKYKRGVCIVRKEVKTPIENLISLDKIEELNKQGEIVTRKVWTVDDHIPKFNEDKNYIEQFLKLETV